MVEKDDDIVRALMRGLENERAKFKRLEEKLAPFVAAAASLRRD
jgi:hypothetical protein